MPAWSPNDDEIAFVSQRSASAAARRDIRDSVPGLWAVNAQGRERLVFDAKQNGMPAGAAWSPDGTRLAHTLAGGRLAVNGQLTSAPTRTCSRSGRSWITRTEFIYTADGHIKRQSLDGDDRRSSRSRATVSLQRSTFSIAHRALEPAGPQRVAGIVKPAVSPDGRAIAFTAMGDLWLLPVGGTPVQLTNDAAFELDPAWSPDSTQLAFVSDRGGHMDLWVRDLRTGNGQRR